MTETPLSGGRTTPGVVRVGNTVRRPAMANAVFAAQLLRHLEHVGFSGAPRTLGRDEQGRDMLSYINGDVPLDLGWYDDNVLAVAARLIRQYHDATVGMAGGAQVICHNDLSPCYFVFQNGQPVAIIDFDAAAPGTRAHDVGYAAWLWLDIGNREIGAAEQQRRLALFGDAYGDMAADVVLQAMLSRQRQLIADGERSGDLALTQWASASLAWTEELAQLR